MLFTFTHELARGALLWVLNRPLQGSFIPSEAKPLVGLKQIDRQTIWAYVNNVKPGLNVSLDIDTQIIETNKSEAKHLLRRLQGISSHEGQLVRDTHFVMTASSQPFTGLSRLLTWLNVFETGQGR